VTFREFLRTDICGLSVYIGNWKSKLCISRT